MPCRPCPFGGQISDKLLGRRFKCSTFILPDRHPTRQYMLAIDAARSSGFRDSLYYFRRNPLALKLSASQKEKEALIQAGKLGAHLKTRSVTLVTARSAYKLHGAKMIIGKWVHALCQFAAHSLISALFRWTLGHG